MEYYCGWSKKTIFPQVQAKHNKDNNITPRSIQKVVKAAGTLSRKTPETVDALDIKPDEIPQSEKKRIIKDLKNKMELAAKNLDFETAAELRDMIRKIQHR